MSPSSFASPSVGGRTTNRPTDGRNLGDQPVEFLLSSEAPKLACRSTTRPARRRSLWRQARLRLSPRAMVLKDVGGLGVNRKRVLRVMRERGRLLRHRRFRVSRRKDWSTVEASPPISSGSPTRPSSGPEPRWVGPIWSPCSTSVLGKSSAGT